MIGVGLARQRPEATGHSFIPGTSLENQAASIVSHQAVESRAPRGVERAFAGIRKQAAQFELCTGLKGCVTELSVVRRRAKLQRPARRRLC